MTDPNCWFPMNHCYDGTCTGQLVLPHYATMPDRIRVYDTGVRNSGWRRWQKKLWRKARNAALARWTYPVEVIERGLVRGDYLDQGITLDHFTTTVGYGANSYGGFGLSKPDNPANADFDPNAWARGRGFALINDREVSSAFASRVTGRLSGVICHEVGHALGFGHGGTGIMETTVNPPYYPDDTELWAAERYWGRP